MPRGLGASILCILPALYFLGIMAYAAMNSPYYSLTWVLFNRYILGPACIAAFLIISAIWVQRDVRLTIGIVATSLLSGLFLFETFLTFVDVPKRLGNMGVTAKGVIDSRFHGNLPPAYGIKRLNREIETKTLSEAVLGALPGEAVFLCALDGQPVSYVPDRYGFRNPDHLWESQADLLLLGDSFTEGICQPDGADLAGQLRKHHERTLTTGTRGAGPLFELAVLGRIGPEISPKVTAFIFFAGNDWDNLSSELNTPWLTEALNVESNFGSPKPPKALIEKSNRVINRWWRDADFSVYGILSKRKSRFVRNFLALQYTSMVLGLHYPSGSLDKPEFDDILNRASQIVSNWNGNLILVFVPSVDRYVGVFQRGIAHDQLRELVLSSAEREGVATVDLTTVFEESDTPKLMYAADSHFSKEGARVAAQAIADKVNEINESE